MREWIFEFLFRNKIVHAMLKWNPDTHKMTASIFNSMRNHCFPFEQPTITTQAIQIIKKNALFEFNKFK